MLMKHKIISCFVALLMGGSVVYATPRKVVQKQVVQQVPVGVAKIEKRFVEYNPYNPYVVGVPVESLGLGYYYSAGDDSKIKALQAEIDELKTRLAEVEGAFSDLLDKLEAANGGKTDGGGDSPVVPVVPPTGEDLTVMRRHIKELLTSKYNCKKCHNQSMKKGDFQIFDGDNIIVWNDQEAMEKIAEAMEDGSMPKRPDTEFESGKVLKEDVQYVESFNRKNFEGVK